MENESIREFRLCLRITNDMIRTVPKLSLATRRRIAERLALRLYRMERFK